MKQITKIEQVPKELVKFVADDGTEFQDKLECRNYERERYRNLLKEKGVETCGEAEGFPNFDGGENYESHSYYWYRPKSLEEIELLRQAFELDGDAGVRSHFHDGMVGKWICIETDVGDDFVWLTELDDSIIYASELLAKLGYEMTISEVQNNG